MKQEASAVIRELRDNVRRSYDDLIDRMPSAALSDAQVRLAAKHGTPRGFARACVNAIGEITTKEAEDAIQKYLTEWKAAA